MSVLISLDQLKEGMVLQAPAKNKYGQVLLAEGAVLQPQHKRLLSMWGITMVLVHDPNDTKKELVFDQSVLGQAAEALEKRITWQPETPMEKDLLEMAARGVLKKMTQVEE